MSTEAFLDGFWSDIWVGRAHLVLALTALVAGPVIFLRRKGTRAHRALGVGYIAAMLIVNVAALSMYRMTGGPNHFHVLAAISLGTVIPGTVAVLRRNIRAHYFFMTWSYVGLLAAFLSQVASQAPAVFENDRLFGGASPLALVALGSLAVFALAAFLIFGQASAMLGRYARRAGP
jgi:uncharacterized membrane protein